MSWQIINEMLGLAIVDPAFREKLLQAPLVAAKDQGFELTINEEHLIQSIHAHDLSEFSQRIIEAKNLAWHLGREF
jgi:hypothetical protein